MLKKVSIYALAPLLFLISGQAQNLEVLGEYKIGIVGQDQEDTIYQTAHLGAQEASREMSRRYSIDVELIVLTPDSSQGGDQQTSLGQLFIEAADGFLISPDRSVLDAVRFAQQQGQEIVFFETELKAIEPLASIVADEYTAGTLAGQNMLQRLPTKGRTAILMAKDPSPAMQQRLQGVRAAMGYKRIETIVTCEPNYAAAIEAIREAEARDANDLIKGWIFLDDWPLLGMPALPWKPGRLPCVAIQSSPSAFLYIDQGYVSALVVHPYYDWGYQGLVTLIEKLHMNQVPATPHRMTAPKVIDWRNIQDYRDSWKYWLR